MLKDRPISVVTHVPPDSFHRRHRTWTALEVVVIATLAGLTLFLIH